MLYIFQLGSCVDAKMTSIPRYVNEHSIVGSPTAGIVREVAVAKARVPRMAAMLRFRAAAMRGWMPGNCCFPSSADSVVALSAVGCAFSVEFSCRPNSLGGRREPGRAKDIVLEPGVEVAAAFVAATATAARGSSACDLAVRFIVWGWTAWRAGPSSCLSGFAESWALTLVVSPLLVA